MFSLCYKIFDAFSETNSLISADFVNGLDGFVMSIGVIIAIIIGVVVLITGFAIVIVCCCCKAGGNQYDQHGAMKLKRQSGTPQGNTNQRAVVEPSGKV